jgi:hypothetical protein
MSITLLFDTPKTAVEAGGDPCFPKRASIFSKRASIFSKVAAF